MKEWLEKRQGIVRFCALGLTVILLGGCGMNPSVESSFPEAGSTASVSTGAPKLDNDGFHTAAAGKSLQDGADDLVREMTLDAQERKVASQAATREAEKLVTELRYGDAESKLEEALRLDPTNEKRFADFASQFLRDMSTEPPRSLRSDCFPATRQNGCMQFIRGGHRPGDPPRAPRGEEEGGRATGASARVDHL